MMVGCNGRRTVADVEPANDDEEAFEGSAWFEGFCERLFYVALSAARVEWDEQGRRDGPEGMPRPEQALVTSLTAHADVVSVERQKVALEGAAEYGEEMIRRAEVELVEMRRAVEALRQPRSELLRSKMGLVKPPKA